MRKFILFILFSVLAILLLLLLSNPPFMVAQGYDTSTPAPRITTTVCLGWGENCTPLTTVEPTPTIYWCPIEWCPYPPVGVRCQCPIQYTLIAPQENTTWQSLLIKIRAVFELADK